MKSRARAESPTGAYKAYSAQLIQVRRLTATTYIDLSSPVKASQIAALKDNLTSQRDQLIDYMAVEGILRAAASEEDVAHNLQAAHDALIVEINAVLTAIDAITVVTLPPRDTLALKDQLALLRAEIVVV